MKHRAEFAVLLALALVGTVGVGGCRDTWPHSFVWHPGDLSRTHPEPAEGGYYTNWDPFAAEIEVVPVSSVNPVGTQHILIATVKDHEGKPLPGRRIEWSIAEGGVGAFIEVDASGVRVSRGHKENNTFAITHTNADPHVLTRGNDDPNDDIHLARGQSWVVISSPTEGSTHVIAYVPAIYDWEKHKVMVVKHWYDVAVEMPPDDINPVGTPHQLVTKVVKYSDGTPLAGYEVTYRILSGPEALFSKGSQTATVISNSDGLATITLNQSVKAEGTNEIEVQVVRPEDRACCKAAVHIITDTVTKTWIAPSIKINKTAPARALVGETFRYSIVLASTGKSTAENVTVTDTLPAGIKYVASQPQASVAGQTLTWRLGSVEPGGTRSIMVDVQAMRTGRFTNCAEVSAAGGLADRSCADTVVAKAELTLKKEAPAETILCDVIPYVLTVRNTGDAPATNVKITDNMPDGIQSVEGRQTVTITVGTLPPGQAKAYKIRAKSTKTGTFTNEAVAEGDGGLTARATARTVVRKPVLQLSKSCPAEQFISRVLVCTLTVRNTGDAEARDTVITDTLPAGIAFVSATEGGQLSGGKVVWSLGSLAPGKSKTVSMKIKGTNPGSYINRATASAYCADATAEVKFLLRGIPALLLECVDVQDPIAVGEDETYVITVTNQGSAIGRAIKIVAILPPEQEYVRAEGPTEVKVDGRTITFTPLAELEPKATATYRIMSRGVKAGDSRFKVILTSKQLVKPVEETESTTIFTEE